MESNLFLKLKAHLKRVFAAKLAPVANARAEAGEEDPKEKEMPGPTRERKPPRLFDLEEVKLKKQ